MARKSTLLSTSSAPDAGVRSSTRPPSTSIAPMAQCLRPTDVGLTVAPRARLTWSVPVRVPVAVDDAGNVVEWLEVDP